MGDYDDRMPRSFFGSLNGADKTTHTTYKWMDAIFPYVKSEQLFVCPSESAAKYTYSGNLAVGAESDDYGSYGQNGAYSAGGDNQTPPRSSHLPAPGGTLIALSSIISPASTIWATDINSRQGTDRSYGILWANGAANPTIKSNADDVSIPAGNRQLEKIIDRHLSTTNVLYCDGHVKAQKLESLAATTDVGGSTVMTQFTIEDD
jgi:prepilin-type processing-associated H-X9-DG protein